MPENSKLSIAKKDSSERWCDCFHEHYERGDKIENYLEQIELGQGDDALDLIEDEQLKQKFPLKWKNINFHFDKYAETQRAWDIVEEVFYKAAKKGTKRLILSEHMDKTDFKALNTLPSSIANLKDLTELQIYRSQISYLPREIMHCKNLRIFTPYTSYRLHWFPYEITKCQLLKTTISTRALYGNYKLRTPFPDLRQRAWEWPNKENFCSVCLKKSDQLSQYWISQRIGTDVVPLLASVCDSFCLSALGDPAPQHVPYPHEGGPLLTQPAPSSFY